jgi:hypothetical protein
MTAVAGTTDTYDLSTQVREDLEDVIWDLFPMDTWALTNLDKVDCESTKHEWQADSLDAATLNAVVEGDDVAFTTSTIGAATRYNNYCQISRKQFVISDTTEVVTQAGIKSQVARTTMKRMRELKRDIEKAILGNSGSCAGSQAVARLAAGMEAWIASTDQGGNGIKGTTTNAGSSIGFSSGAVTTPTDGGSFGGLGQTQLNSALQAAWEDGGNASVIIVNATHKATVDGFTSQATRTVDVDSAGEIPILTAANVYVSDFGKHTVMLSRYLRTNPSVALCIDPEFWATGWLRRPKMVPLAKTGDGEKRMIIAEWTLVARNPNSSAKVFALS